MNMGHHLAQSAATCGAKRWIALRDPRGWGWGIGARRAQAAGVGPTRARGWVPAPGFSLHGSSRPHTGAGMGDRPPSVPPAAASAPHGRGDGGQGRIFGD